MMPRRFPRIVLAVCAVVILLWFLSEFFGIGIKVGYDHHTLWIYSGPGWIGFTVSWKHLNPTWVSSIDLNRFPPALLQPQQFPSVYTGFFGGYHFYTPTWIPAAAAGLVAFAALVSFYLHRAPAGSCPQCRYDLRATPNRCPECGWGK